MQTNFTLKDAKRHMIKNGLRKRDAMTKMVHMTDVERINYLIGLGKEKKKNRGPIPERGISCCCGKCSACPVTSNCEYIREYYIRWG